MRSNKHELDEGDARRGKRRVFVVTLSHELVISARSFAEAERLAKRAAEQEDYSYDELHAVSREALTLEDIPKGWANVAPYGVHYEDEGFLARELPPRLSEEEGVEDGFNR